MARKTVNFNKTGAEKLPDSKPVVYKIQTESGKTNYVGVAKRGRVQDKLIGQHIETGKIPRRPDRTSRLDGEARKKEGNIIARTQQKYNEQGKSCHRLRCASHKELLERLTLFTRTDL